MSLEGGDVSNVRVRWREKDHPREPKGKPTGGQFTSKDRPVIRVRFKGGPGSGNFGHAGRPGQVGGSAPGGGGNYGGYDEPQGFLAYRQWRQDRQEKMEPKTPVLPGRPRLIWGSPLSGDTGLNPNERKMLESYFREFDPKLPSWYGSEGVYITVQGRHPSKTSQATGHASPSTIFIDVPVFAEHSPDKIKRILAHEIGHTIRGQSRKMAQAFRDIYGTGPYKSGTAGVTSRYHLQNDSELFSKLTERYFVDDDAPGEFVRLWKAGL